MDEPILSAAEGRSAPYPLERIFSRSSPATRQLFLRFSVPPAVAHDLLNVSLPALESCHGTLPGSAHRLLDGLEAACRRFGDRRPSDRGFSEESYDSVLAAIAEALRSRRQRQERQRREAPALAETLRQELDAGLLPGDLSWDPSRCSSALAERLLDLCRQSWSKEWDRAERYAQAAIVVLDLAADTGSPGLDRESPGVIQDLTARAWTYVANIRRRRGEFRAAEQAFAAAEACLNRGSRHPLERAHALMIESTLRREQGRYPDALRLLQQAAAIFRWAGDRASEASAYQRMATTQSYAGNHKLAIPLSERALKLTDPEKDPWAYTMMTHNLAVQLCDLDRYSEARSMLPKLQELFDRNAQSEYQRLAQVWLEARILLGEGRTSPALALLESLRDRYLTLESPFDAALVSLELVAEYLELGQPRPARELAAQALTLCQSLEVERETLAALVALRQATELETATVGWVRGVIDSLRRPGPRPAQSPAQPS